MIRIVLLILVFAVSIASPAALVAADKPSKKGASVKDVKSMPEQQQIALALSAAPAHIAKDAAVMVYGEDGKLKEVKAGTNGFTCIPTVMNLPEPDPMCMDAAVRQWMTEDPLTASADMGVEEAAQVMLEHNFRHLPIVDESGGVVGLVSLRRVVAATKAAAHNRA